MPRANWKNASFPVDEIEDLRLELEREGVRLVPNPGILDLHRALRKDWKKLLRSGPAPVPVALNPNPAITLPETGNSQSPTRDQAASDQQRRQGELELDILREKNRLATQTFNIENVKRKREFWGAVRKGLVVPPERFQSKQTGATLSPPVGRVYCRLHNAYHDTWPCEEVKKAHMETGIPVPPPEYRP